MLLKKSRNILKINNRNVYLSLYLNNNNNNNNSIRYFFNDKKPTAEDYEKNKKEIKEMLERESERLSDQMDLFDKIHKEGVRKLRERQEIEMKNKKEEKKIAPKLTYGDHANEVDRRVQALLDSGRFEKRILLGPHPFFKTSDYKRTEDLFEWQTEFRDFQAERFRLFSKSAWWYIPAIGIPVYIIIKAFNKKSEDEKIEFGWSGSHIMNEHTPEPVKKAYNEYRRKNLRQNAPKGRHFYKEENRIAENFSEKEWDVFFVESMEKRLNRMKERLELERKKADDRKQQFILYGNGIRGDLRNVGLVDHQGNELYQFK